MSFGDLEIIAGLERCALPAVAPVFGATGGSEVVVSFDPPSTATLHVYAREIADGDLTCSLGARRAAVTMDLALAARIVAEGLARGLTLPREASAALAEVLAQRKR